MSGKDYIADAVHELMLSVDTLNDLTETVAKVNGHSNNRAVTALTLQKTKEVRSKLETVENFLRLSEHGGKKYEHFKGATYER